MEKVEATIFLARSGETIAVHKASDRLKTISKVDFRFHSMHLQYAAIEKKSQSRPNSVSFELVVKKKGAKNNIFGRPTSIYAKKYFSVQLDGFTIDYMPEPDVDLYPLGGKHFFTAIKEGDELKFATDDENERHLWVQALYRATGQAYKPVPPKPASGALAPTKAQGFADKASKHGLDDVSEQTRVIVRRVLLPKTWSFSDNLNSF